MLESGFVIVVNGMCSSAARNDRKSAPTMAMAPWAKLTTWVPLKISTNPSATSAYVEPSPTALATVWTMMAGSTINRIR